MPKKYKYRKDFTYEGRRYTVHADTEREIPIKIANKIEKLRSGYNAAGEDMTLEHWGRICIDTYKQNQSPETKRRYINRINRCIFVPLGHKKLQKISSLDLQRLLNDQTGKSLTQINEVYNALRLFFTRALYNGYIHTDPTLGLVKPKNRPVERRRALTPTERAAVEKVASKDRRYYVFLLMLYCGCRPKEAEGVMGKDIVLISDTPMLHIRGTKTKNADRYVPIPAKFYNLIKDTPDDEFIAQSSRGNKLGSENRYRLWSWFIRECNIESGAKLYRNKIIEPAFAEDLTPYSLRHEYCTELARRKVDIRTAQKLMGHATIAMTANIYTHVDMDEIISVAGVLDD